MKSDCRIVVTRVEKRIQWTIMEDIDWYFGGGYVVVLYILKRFENIP